MFSVAGLLLLAALVLSVLGDVRIVGERTMGGDGKAICDSIFCFSLAYEASVLTAALLGAVALWVSVGCWFARSALRPARSLLPAIAHGERVLIGAASAFTVTVLAVVVALARYPHRWMAQAGSEGKCRSPLDASSTLVQWTGMSSER